jgi:NTP pyrophosphatase (non-canonical NTP hydrolase)
MSSKVLDLVKTERKRQDAKWGKQNHTPQVWLTILAEEFGEVAKEVCDYNFMPSSTPDHLGFAKLEIAKRIKEELIQTAAVAVAMIESLERNELK